MKMTRVLVVMMCLVALVGCGGASQEEASAQAETNKVEPTPVFSEDFESGEAEGWTGGDQPQPEEEPAAGAPTEQ